jgi:hypothetical protein
VGVWGLCVTAWNERVAASGFYCALMLLIVTYKAILLSIMADVKLGNPCFKCSCQVLIPASAPSRLQKYVPPFRPRRALTLLENSDQLQFRKCRKLLSMKLTCPRLPGPTDAASSCRCKVLLSILALCFRLLLLLVLFSRLAQFPLQQCPKPPDTLS